MLNYTRYTELESQIKALKKELDALKLEIKAELKKGDFLVIDDKIVYSDGTAKLTLYADERINTAAAWELIKAQPDSDKYINHNTSERLTVKQ